MAISALLGAAGGDFVQQPAANGGHFANEGGDIYRIGMTQKPIDPKRSLRREQANFLIEEFAGGDGVKNDVVAFALGEFFWLRATSAGLA